MTKVIAERPLTPDEKKAVEQIKKKKERDKELKEQSKAREEATDQNQQVLRTIEWKTIAEQEQFIHFRFEFINKHSLIADNDRLYRWDRERLRYYPISLTRLQTMLNQRLAEDELGTSPTSLKAMAQHVHAYVLNNMKWIPEHGFRNGHKLAEPDLSKVSEDEWVTDAVAVGNKAMRIVNFKPVFESRTPDVVWLADPQLPIAETPQEASPLLSTTLDQWFDLDDEKEYWKMVVGAMANPRIFPTFLLIVHGNERTGKGVTDKLIQNWVGVENVKAFTGLSDVSPKEALGGIHTKSYVTIPEFPDIQDDSLHRAAVVKLKAVVSKDLVSSRMLYQNASSVMPECSVGWYGNVDFTRIGILGEHVDSILDRVVYMEMIKTIARKDRNPYLHEELNTPENRRHLLDAALAAAERNGKLNMGMFEPKLEAQLAFEEKTRERERASRLKSKAAPKKLDYKDYISLKFEITEDPDDYELATAVTDVFNGYAKKYLKRFKEDMQGINRQLDMLYDNGRWKKKDNKPVIYGLRIRQSANKPDPEMQAKLEAASLDTPKEYN